MSKAYVLLSGGIDSTTCLYLAYKQFGTLGENGPMENVEAISINYGQRHSTELAYAKQSCVLLRIPHRVVDLSSIIPKTMLTETNSKIPNMSYDQIKGVSPTYVPFRNGLLLSAIVSIIHGEYARDITNYEHEWAIYFGAHAEDAQNWAYPDCTPEFIGAMANAIYIGTYRAVRLHTPLEWLDKKSIIELGETLHVDWSKTWSCYAGGVKHCGACPTCRARKAGFLAAGVKDPTEYTK